MRWISGETSDTHHAFHVLKVDGDHEISIDERTNRNGWTVAWITCGVTSHIRRTYKRLYYAKRYALKLLKEHLLQQCKCDTCESQLHIHTEQLSYRVTSILQCLKCHNELLYLNDHAVKYMPADLEIMLLSARLGRP